MRLPTLAFASFLGLASTLVADVPEVGTPINSIPKVITKPGVYTVKKNLILSQTNGIAIIVQAPDVTIDFNGHIISSSAPADHSINTSKGVVMSSGTNLTVRNGTLRGFHTAMYLNGPYAPQGNMLIQNMRCEQSIENGIYVSAGGAVTVRNCTVSETGQGPDPLVSVTLYGILVQSTFAEISDCTVLNTIPWSISDARAIQASASEVIVEHCRVINTASVSGGLKTYGIFLFGGTGNFASDNMISNCTTGMSFNSGVPGKYSNNLTTGCTTGIIPNSAISVGANN